MDIESNSGLRMALRERPKRRHSERSDDMRFLEDFDSDRVDRERRRQRRKLPSGVKVTQYDENGLMRSNGLDLCDCMDNSCEGCWNECKSCGSFKCGLTCRVNRRYCYDSITFDGKDGIIRNPNVPMK